MVERKNRTLEDMARTILCESNLTISFRPEAINTTNYILNRCLIHPILKNPPYELFKGRKLNISYFTFRCKCFTHSNGKETLDEFDARNDECILVGYSMHSTTYRIYNKRTRSIEESIHIVFYESNDGNISSSFFQELRPKEHPVIETKWAFRNKLVESENVVRNKVILVAKGYNQEEGIDFDETFAPVARLEVICILIAFASYMAIKRFQMDVKCVFLNSFLQEEIYVEQPPDFENSDLPNRVFKLPKALYRLKQAHRAWYKRLSKFSLENDFRRGQIHKILFIKTRGRILSLYKFILMIHFSKLLTNIYAKNSINS